MPPLSSIITYRLYRASNKFHRYSSGATLSWLVSNGSVEHIKENTVFEYWENCIISHWHILKNALIPKGWLSSSFSIDMSAISISANSEGIWMYRFSGYYHKRWGQPLNDCPRYRELEFQWIPLSLNLHAVFITNNLHALLLCLLGFLNESD